MPKKKENELKVVSIRLVKEPSLYAETSISSARDVLKLVSKELASYDREVFAILNLKSNGQVINMNICSVGTLNASMVSPREVFKSSILSNAASFIAIHNHPSVNRNPSQEDHEVTRRLMECGKLLDIKMLDHIIVAGETAEMTSFRANGILDSMERNSRDMVR